MLNDIESKEQKRIEAIQNSYHNQIKTIKNEISKTQRISNLAMRRIYEYRNPTDDASKAESLVWARNYSDLLSSYEIAMAENAKLRKQLKTLVHTYIISRDLS